MESTMPGPKNNVFNLDDFTDKFTAFGGKASGLNYGLITGSDNFHMKCKYNPRKCFGPHGEFYVADELEIVIPIPGEPFSIRESSLDEIMTVVEQLNRNQQHIGLPVQLKPHTGVDYFGVLDKIFEDEFLIKPAAVFRFNEDGTYSRRRETERHTTVLRPAEIMPVTWDDLNFMIKASEEDRKAADMKNRLELFELEEAFQKVTNGNGHVVTEE